MEVFSSVLTIIQAGLQFVALCLGAWGLVTVGLGLKNHEGPQMQNGFLGVAGAVVVYVAAQLFGTISIPSVGAGAGEFIGIVATLII